MDANTTLVLPGRTLRRAGWVLVGYGAAGLLLVAATLLAIGPLVARASLAADSAGGTVAQAAVALDHSAAAFDGFGHSLDDAKVSSAHAAQLLNDAATTSGQLADAMAVSIFGAQPLLPLAQSFRRNSDELRGVSEDLRTLSGAIGRNAGDVARIRDDLRALRDQVARIAAESAAAPNAPTVGPALRILLGGLALWLGLLAAAALGGGILLLRR